MKTQTTVVTPVHVGLCRGCRFALHIAEAVREEQVLVWCIRRDCDNTHPERLAPLLPFDAARSRATLGMTGRELPRARSIREWLASCLTWLRRLCLRAQQ